MSRGSAIVGRCFCHPSRSRHIANSAHVVVTLSYYSAYPVTSLYVVRLLSYVHLHIPSHPLCMAPSDFAAMQQLLEEAKPCCIAMKLGPQKWLLIAYTPDDSEASTVSFFLHLLLCVPLSPTPPRRLLSHMRIRTCVCSCDSVILVYISLLQPLNSFVRSIRLLLCATVLEEALSASCSGQYVWNIRHSSIEYSVFTNSTEACRP